MPLRKGLRVPLRSPASGRRNPPGAHAGWALRPRIVVSGRAFQIRIRFTVGRRSGMPHPVAAWVRPVPAQPAQRRRERDLLTARDRALGEAVRLPEQLPSSVAVLTQSGPSPVPAELRSVRAFVPSLRSTFKLANELAFFGLVRGKGFAVRSLAGAHPGDHRGAARAAGPRGAGAACPSWPTQG
jgi:hypothetical protein